MPIYEYQCSTCAHCIDTFTSRKKKGCPKCDGKIYLIGFDKTEINSKVLRNLMRRIADLENRILALESTFEELGDGESEDTPQESKSYLN